MTNHDTRSRKLRGFGFLATLGMALCLLPSWQTSAQQNTAGSADQAGATGSTTQPSQDIQKARAALERATADLEKAQAQLELMRRQIEERKAQMKDATAQLKQAERAAALQRIEGELKAKTGPTKARFTTTGGQGGMDKRLSDMESKLDQVLDELQELRKSMGKGPGFAPGKKGKGGGFGGGGGGGGGGFGGAESPPRIP